MERNTKSRLDSHPAATASLFTDDLILEILSRLPARSVHRFKCVSVAWRDLIADPANRKKLPQTLAGFLYISYRSGHRHHFASVSGGLAPFDPSLPYLQPNKDEGIAQVDACNGLLLYRRYTKNMVTLWTEGDFHFVVCNPATGRWLELPPQPQPPAPTNIHSPTAGLAFDPVVSSHFHVLTFEETNMEAYLTGVNIYSSRTRAWSRRDSGMVEKATLLRSKCVFVGGMLYLMGNLEDMNGEYVLVGVDMEGKVWKTIHVPYGSKFGTIGSSQGCLHYAVAYVDDNNETLVSEISLWCLKDNESKGLVLKHTTSIDKLMSMTGKTYRVVEIHPDCDTIFLVSNDGDTLAAYDMRHQKVGYILNLENNTQQFLPYVPMFSELLADADEH
ncbi:F-box protein At1g47340-like [Triticum urartu]|uniref:F-box protein At1g47340-like n=1 Tax=Triticum urartu TaxID=4572 RepID=UPI002044BC01|nr:F-box protein At1g47340-like [Triticum urartu]